MLHCYVFCRLRVILVHAIIMFCTKSPSFENLFSQGYDNHGICKLKQPNFSSIWALNALGPLVDRIQTK